MKKLSVILLSGVVFVLAGCGNQGGSSDPYNTESGTSNTNYNRVSPTNDSQGGAQSPGRIDAGADFSTNYPGLGTNDQGLPGLPEGTNSVPAN